ncbi:glycyl-tRNA synthetase beta chain [Evansella caseinilytica]|uniref:Glycine--tRNA ligase beta subunit n=1 Tax=Evansella caseinilytica TaxID=1503961 RepID=A0A1H3KJL6_9BACI|nr:glycine--tRNA ligase subunit beta [Evansella caseinilytica]SDY52259.1 glycyl-tRNA synthetase beta chain [Evansella caseinilytica]
MNKHTFLLEIGLEEMPARFVSASIRQLTAKVDSWLHDHQLAFESIHAYATPRRLAVLVKGLAEKQGDKEEEVRGPAKKIALDQEGNWTKAAQGFSRGQGVDVADLYFQEIKGEEYVFVKKFTEGRQTTALLPEIKEVVTGLQFPKNMKWGSHQLRYVRPIKWIVAMFGKDVIPFEITGVETAVRTLGHRFLGKQIELAHADDYAEALLREFVLPDPEERKAAIRSQIQHIADAEGWNIPIDEGLLEEVTNLVEYPTALYGQFDERFLNVPEDVLITSMREHQRYFPVKDKAGNLLPYFVTVRNGDHRHLENVQKGNEKVLRARLADAEFFYHEDLKQPLENGLKRLETIVYHEELGSIGDKVRRIKELAQQLGELAGLPNEQLEYVRRAAELCKADLVTQMVYEFPELEGKMGEEYARKSGEAPEVATAIYEHYLPKQSGDPVPATDIGAVVSIADKLDTVVSSFGIGQIPTGSQDPHGLRRQAAGIVQIFLDRNWKVDMLKVVDQAIKLCEKKGLLKRGQEDIRNDLVEFLKLRIKNLLQERGVQYDVIDAVLNTDIGNVQALVQKAQFLMERHSEEEFKHAVEAFSRVTNIAKKTSDPSRAVSEALLQKKEERELQRVTEEISGVMPELLTKGEIAAAYEELKRLTPVIHDYFDNIMVMAEDAEVKANRLAQMTETSRLILVFADFQAIVFHSEVESS